MFQRTKNLQNHKTTQPPQSPQTLCRFIGSWGPADSLLSPERGHFLGDGWQESTKNSQPLALRQWREFKAWIFKTERSLLNDALPREMSSQLDDSVQSTPKMCWMLQYTTSMVIPWYKGLMVKPSPSVTYWWSRVSHKFWSQKLEQVTPKKYGDKTELLQTAQFVHVGRWGVTVQLREHLWNFRVIFVHFA